MDDFQDEFNFEDWNGDEQRENLERVSSRIGRAIVQFCSERGAGKRFHADELRNHVTAATGINAPASADRVLRDLRQRNKLGYTVVSRRESLYEVNWVGKAKEETS